MLPSGLDGWRPTSWRPLDTGCNLSSRLFGAALGKIAAITGTAGHSGRGSGIRTWRTPQPAQRRRLVEVVVETDGAGNGGLG